MSENKFYRHLNELFPRLCGVINAHPYCFNGIILAAAAGIFFLFSWLTPYVYDDIVYHYCYIPGKSFFDISPDTALVNSFADVWRSVQAFFFSWSGRVVPGLTIYTLFWQGKMLFNLLNGVMAAAVIWCICRHICGKEKVKPLLLLTISALFFLCAPSPGLTLFWANGAVIYMWTALFYLLLLLPYRNFLEYGEPSRGSWYCRLYLLPVGVIGCNANENVAASALLIIVLTMICAVWKHRRIPVWMYYGLAGALIGCGVLFGAPGVYQRVVFEGHQGIPVIANIFTQSAHLFYTIPGLFASVLLLAVFTFSKMSAERRLVTLFYLLLIGAAGYSMIFSPYVPGRAVFGSFVFMLCLLGVIWQPLDIAEQWRCIIAGSCAAAALMSGAFAMRDIAFTGRIHRQRMQAMAAAEKEQVSRDWVFRPVCGMSRYNALYKTDTIREDAGHFLNRHYARKYNQKSVRVTSVPAVQGMVENIFPEEK